MADITELEPMEGTPEPTVTRSDIVEELIETLGDTFTLYLRAHGAHWNVKGPAFGAYHELFGSIAGEIYGAVDPMAEQLLKLDTDAPSTLEEMVSRRTVTPAPLDSDDPQVLAEDLRALNDAVLVSLEEAFDCASDSEEQGLANFLADRIDAHKKHAWQLKRSVSNAAEKPVTAPVSPPEATEVEDGDELSPTAYGRGLRVVSERDLRETPGLVTELRGAPADVIEQRTAPANVEIRSNADGTWQLEGLAAVFDSPSQDLGGFREVLKRGSFKRVIKDAALDCRALINHDPNLLLGRTVNGTLRLEETPRGLKYTVDVPATTYGNDLRVLLERGDLTQSSFAFRVGKEDQTWEEDPTSGGLIRTITNVTSLMDCSVVTYPAYLDATAGVAQTSNRSTEQDTQAAAAEPSEQAVDEARRREEAERSRAKRERELRLRERLHKQ